MKNIIIALIIATFSFSFVSAQSSFYADTIKFEQNESIVNNSLLTSNIASECITSITGYASVEGSKRSNLSLSAKRAGNVADALSVNKSIVVAKGETNDFGSELKNNRIVIVYSDKTCIDNSLSQATLDTITNVVNKPSRKVKNNINTRPSDSTVNVSVGNDIDTTTQINTELLLLDTIQIIRYPTFNEELMDTTLIKINLKTTSNACDCDKLLVIRDAAEEQYIQAGKEWNNTRGSKEAHIAARILMHESLRYWNHTSVEARKCQYQCFASDTKTKAKSKKSKGKRIVFKPTRGKSTKGFLVKLFPYMNC